MFALTLLVVVMYAFLGLVLYLANCPTGWAVFLFVVAVAGWGTGLVIGSGA